MLGNRLGWFIAAVLAIAMGFAAWRVSKVNDLTPLTALGESDDVYEPLTLPMQPSAIVTMDRTADAGKMYRSVIDQVQRDPARYQAFVDAGRPKDFDAMPAMQTLIDATPLVGGDILLTHASANVGYTGESDELKTLLLAGHCLSRMALLIAKDDPVRANELYRAEFALGAKLFSERIGYYEAFDGIGLMQEATGGLRLSATAQHDTLLLNALKQFDAGLDEFITQKLEPMWTVISSVDSDVIAEHAGDIYAFTGPQMKERLWRIEAILKLGRHKYNVARLADQVIVPIRLNALKANETDPAILAAIDAAQHLTLEQYHMIR